MYGRPLKKRRLDSEGNYVVTKREPLPTFDQPMQQGSFPRASPQVMATRRIVRAKRRSDKLTGMPSPQKAPTTLVPTPSFDFSRIDTHSSVMEMGAWQMNPSRRKDLDNTFSGYSSKSSVQSSNIRIGSEKTSGQGWGNSADENVRTQSLRDKKSKMTKPEQELSFYQRSHQGGLVWKTGSSSLTQYGDKADISVPISAHTPGVKSKHVGGTAGAKTKEHGRRDSRRESVVATTLNDPNRLDTDVPVMSKLATVQLMQSPKEELDTTKPKVQSFSDPLYSIWDDIGDITDKSSPGFENLGQRVQTIRETDKMHSALNMLATGRESLVPDQHKQLLTQAKGNVSQAMKLLEQQSKSTAPNMTFNTATSSQTTRLDSTSLGQMAVENTKKPGTHRPLSPPRHVEDSTYEF